MLQETLRLVWLSTSELYYTVAVLYDASIALPTLCVNAAQTKTTGRKVRFPTRLVCRHLNVRWRPTGTVTG